MSTRSAWRTWKNFRRETRLRAIVTRAVLRIANDLASEGVVDIQWFLGYYLDPVMWLVTDTDVGRDRVAARGYFSSVVTEHLKSAGYPPELLDETAVTAESRETVDRDYDGNWWHAMK